MRRPLLLCALAVGLFAGCGAKLTPVTGTVIYDGDPIEGATVVFTDESGSKSAFGRTDAAGKFALSYNDGPGIPPGSYKATVTYKKAMENVVSPSSPESANKEYLAQMKAKEVVKSTGPPAGMMPGVTKAAKADIGELPVIYASPATTPFTFQVPVSGPVELKLEKKKK